MFLKLLFWGITAVVLVNAFLHDPLSGYDARGHLWNVRYLAQLSLPDATQSPEFFSPSLPYVVPAVVYAFGEFLGLSDKMAIGIAAKMGQAINVPLSLGVTFLMLLICQSVRPGKSILKITSLSMLGILTVYYKSFSQVRPEPYVAFFYLLAVYMILRLTEEKGGLSNKIGLGVCLGMLILSRQWGFFIFPAMGILFLVRILADREKTAYYVNLLAISVAVAFLTGGWFYGQLYYRNGKITAFNLAPADGFSLSNQPRSFYFDLALDKVFSSPVRPAFENRFFPIMYSEIWGDYWCYFLADIEKPLDASALLGRINLVGIYPTVLLIVGYFLVLVYFVKYFVFWSKRKLDTAEFKLSFMLLVVTCYLLGYTWFLIQYPKPGKGDTVKATYIIGVFPFLSLFAGELITRIGEFSPSMQRILLAGLVMVGAHNLPILFTRHWWFDKLWLILQK